MLSGPTNWNWILVSFRQSSMWFVIGVGHGTLTKWSNAIMLVPVRQEINVFSVSDGDNCACCS